ncbi:hypothetical protein E2562_013673 [Oryza meyeriana var. granulata]|uniref:Uncharacterized protein n=1 Tax=Oryza meyeriana var. granulata TaxID=110450 RepID=A0A6G1BJJ7_9ORYZ|nr:hypothetical protein E2562_013673 [Oryza meyeriana var. granulata]
MPIQEHRCAVLDVLRPCAIPSKPELQSSPNAVCVVLRLGHPLFQPRACTVDAESPRLRSAPRLAAAHPKSFLVTEPPPLSLCHLGELPSELS